MWREHRFKSPILQAVHALWSLGATIGPFIIGLFLVDLHQRSDSNSSGSSNSTNTSADNVTMLLTGVRRRIRVSSLLKSE